MSKTLLIVESPAKAVKIQKMFKGKVIAIASQGHIKDLAKGKAGIDTSDFSLQYEMMEDKVTGFLIKENDSEDLIKKLTILLDDENLRNKMGDNGKQFVIKKFNWNTIAKKFLENIKPYIKN